MAIHRHRNQTLLDEIGNLGGLPPYVFTSGADEADLRTWSAVHGLRDGADAPIDPAGTVGVSFATLRASPNGTLFARRVTLSNAGTVTGVGPEESIIKAGTAVFQAVVGGLAPKGAAKVGESDDFFVRTPQGVRQRDDFTAVSESPFMKPSGDAENVELKPESGE
jgi:hypothetical protein